MKTYSYLGTHNTSDHTKVCALGRKFGLQNSRKMSIGAKIAQLANDGNEKAIQACEENPKFFGVVIFDNTKDEYNQFQSGYRAAEGDGIVVIDFFTNVDGYNNKSWTVPSEYFYSFGDDLHHNCMCVEYNSETK